MGFGKGLGFGRGRGSGYGLGRGLGKGKGAFSGYSCVKFIFFGFNVLFWLLGCAILGIGIWLQVSKGAYASFSPSFNFFSATMLCIFIGVLILLVGFFGCCGAIMENKCLLMTYFVLVSIIFILEVITVVLLFFYRSHVESYGGNVLYQGIKNTYSIEGEDEEGIRAAWAWVQSSMKCCGVYNYTDWYGIKAFKGKDQVPRECCINNSTCNIINTPSDYYQEGCLKEIKSFIVQNLYIVGIVAIIIIVLQILGLITSLVLACCLRKDKYYE